MFARVFLTVIAIALAGCAPTNGLLVSDTAEHMGGSLFVETNAAGDQFLVLDGEITAETSFVFQVLTDSADISGLVIAQSPGGNLLAAHQVGRAIRREGIHTVVLGSCISACVDIFIAGREREMLQSAELGLHAADERELGYEFDRRYWGELGFGEINEAAYRVPDNALWIISAERALELRLATAVLRDF